MADLRTVRYVTENYVHLQGLRLVPLSAPFFASAVWRAGGLRWWPGTTGRGATYWFLASLALAVGVSFVIRTQYHRRFGQVRSFARDSGAWTLTVCAGCLLGALGMQETLAWPVSLPALFVGVVVGALGAMHGAFRRHYLLIAAACLGFAVLHPLGMSVSTQSVVLDLLIAMGLLTAGIGDHLVLRDAFVSAGAASYVRAV